MDTNYVRMLHLKNYIIIVKFCCIIGEILICMAKKMIETVFPLESMIKFYFCKVLHDIDVIIFIIYLYS